MSKLILIRGLPGAGKTTLAKTNYTSAKNFEADQYFTDSEGNYHFDTSKLKEAHTQCRNNTEAALQEGAPVVVVSNTFVEKWQMRPYLFLARKYKAEFEIITATGNYQNVHNVPLETIEKMKNRWEELDASGSI